MEGKKLAFELAWCKGCGICVALCPRQALILEKGKVAQTDEEKCIHCGQCELRCPDFAIYVETAEGVAAHG